MFSLATTIDKLPFVGPRHLTRLKSLGIKTVRDLLWHFPHRYDDLSHFSPIAAVTPDTTVNIIGRVVELTSQRSWKRRLTITTAWVEDATDSIRVVWFNQPFLEKSLPIGTTISLAGKVKLDKNGPL